MVSLCSLGWSLEINDPPCLTQQKMVTTGMSHHSCSNSFTLNEDIEYLSKISHIIQLGSWRDDILSQFGFRLSAHKNN
jgi:hypothetical protein